LHGGGYVFELRGRCILRCRALKRKGGREGVGEGATEQRVDIGNQQIGNTESTVATAKVRENGTGNRNIGHHGSRQRLLHGRGDRISNEHFTNGDKHVLANDGHVNGLRIYHEAIFLVRERRNKARASVI
jgi:hypothetical protein